MSLLPENPPPMEELRALWTEDCRKIFPDFELFDPERMADELDSVRADLDWPNGSDICVIAKVLRNLDEEKGDIPPYWWWIAACSIMFPWLQITPWLEIGWRLAYESRGKREMHTFWGAASTSKSRFFATIGLTEMVIWIGECHVYVTSPEKVSGDDKIWEAFKQSTDQWQKKPPEWLEELGLTVTSNKDELIISDDEGYVSTAGFESLESASSIIGKKSRKRPDVPSDDRRGRMLLIGDEIIHKPASAINFKAAEGNLVANANVLSFVGINPLPHQVRHSSVLDLSKPTEVSIESLNENTDFTWKTMRGRLIRFCWGTSPNRFARKPVFDFLINEAQAEAATKRGEDNYRAMVAAWGWSGGMGNGGVLTLEATQTPDWQGTPVWKSERKRWAFFDLAFGGNDPAGYCCLETGTAQINGADRDVVHGVDQQKMHVKRNWIPTWDEVQEFKKLAQERGGKAPELVAGKELTNGNAHMVFQMLQIAKQLQIPRGMVSFDSSLRMDVTLMAREALGSVIWFYDGQRDLRTEQEAWPLWPPALSPNGEPMTWADCHGKVISAVWRLAEHLIARGHVMGLSRLTAGCQELISRMWNASSNGNRSDVEGKKTMTSDRDRKMPSPMWGETLSMALMFGVRFCGALPALAAEKAVSVGGGEAFEKHPVFNIRTRRVGRGLWKVA